MRELSTLDGDAIELLRLVGSVLADRVVWTRHAMRAERWKRRRHPKPLRWEGAEPPEEWRKINCGPLDTRAVEWSVLGALELAGDDPQAPEVVRALDLLLVACRGWTISRVEDAGHRLILWAIATAVVVRPGRRLAPWGESKSEVDLRSHRERQESSGAPATERSSERASRRRRAA